MITVDSANLIKTLKKVDRDITDYRDRGSLHNYLTDMWQVGYDRVRTDYASALTLEGEPAMTEYTHVTSVPVWKSDTMELEAYGTDILFLEFGTGIFQSDIHPWGSQFGYIPRSYSAINKQFLFEPKTHHFHGAWPHGGKEHWGQNPAKGMYNASKEMRFFLQNTPFKVF